MPPQSPRRIARKPKSKSSPKRSLRGGEFTESQGNSLPGSLFQLLKLFSKLPYEVSIEVSRSANGSIELFLTKGTEEYVDDYYSSKNLCGIYMHTHPTQVSLRKKEFKRWPPSGFDIAAMIQRIPFRKNKEEIIRGNKIKYNYVFDGFNIWYYRPNPQLIREYLFASEDNRHALVEASLHNANFLSMDLNGLREHLGFSQISNNEYIDGMKDLLNQKTDLDYADDEVMGFDVGVISNLSFREKQIFIPDDLTCRINERRVKHIVLPDSGLLSNDDLQLLFEKSIRIMDKRITEPSMTQDSILG